MCTHWVHLPGAAKLRAWGLLDAVRDSNHPAVINLHFNLGPVALHGSPVPAGDLTTAYAPRRIVLDDGWSNRADLTQALAGYERTRNAASHPMYEFTCQLATLEAPPPPMQKMFAALQTDPVGTSRFLGVFVGTVSPADFFGEAAA